jgi:hypothetical protein
MKVIDLIDSYKELKLITSFSSLMEYEENKGFVVLIILLNKK